jgi:ATP-dependent RNA helicase DeaD
VEAVNERRVARFMERIDAALGMADLSVFRDLVERYERERNIPAAEIAAALAALLQGKTPLLLSPAQAEARSTPAQTPAPTRPARAPREKPAQVRHAPAEGVEMQTYRIDVGHRHHAQAGHIVGAIANEAELDSRYIGRIDICDDYSLVELPSGMPAEVLRHLQNVRVSGRPLRMRLAEPEDMTAPKRRAVSAKGATRPGTRTRPMR